MVIAGLLGGAQAALAGEQFPNVVVTVPALKPYTDALLKDIGQSQNLLRPGQDAHHFSLSSRQRQVLAAADVIIVADRTMHPFLNKLLDAEQKRGATIVVLTSLKEAEALPYTQENPWLEAAEAKAKVMEEHDHHDHGEEAHGQIDPHLWLDPIRMAALAAPIAEAIAARAPDHRGTLKANADVLAHHLREEVDPALRTMLASPSTAKSMRAKPQVPFITYHAAYQYFMARYGLQHGGEIVQRPEDYLGAKTLRDALSNAEKLSIRCVISESDSLLVRRIAKASGARIVAINPDSSVTTADITSADWAESDYDRLLQRTAESFAGCL